MGELGKATLPTGLSPSRAPGALRFDQRLLRRPGAGAPGPDTATAGITAAIGPKSSWPWRRTPKACPCTFRSCGATATTPRLSKASCTRLRRRFGIKEATFVFDGGMSSQINLEAMNAASLGYVTRLSAATLQSLVEELALEKQLELGDRQKLMEITHQAKRYVIAGGPWRQQRDQERRQSRIDKAEAELKRIGGGQAQESGRPKAGQPGGPEPATTQGPQVFYLPGRRVVDLQLVQWLRPFRCRAAPGRRPIASARHRGGRRPRSRLSSQTAAPARRARRRRCASPPSRRDYPVAISANWHSALARRICSGVRARTRMSAGSATTTATHRAREVATLSRLRE